MPEAEPFIIETIRKLIEARGSVPPEITSASVLSTDLDLDSLELAELSVTLEDQLGKDPYSEGIVPNTVGELTAYYA